MIPEILEQRPSFISIEHYAQHVAHRELNKQFCSSVHRNDQMAVRDYVAVWRDASRWLSPPFVTRLILLFL